MSTAPRPAPRTPTDAPAPGSKPRGVEPPPTRGLRFSENELELLRREFASTPFWRDVLMEPARA